LQSLNLHLPQILLHIFHQSQSWSSTSSTSFRFTPKYFLNYLSLIHSYYIANHCNLLLLISATDQPRGLVVRVSDY
jgi:hypothetical protein